MTALVKPKEAQKAQPTTPPVPIAKVIQTETPAQLTVYVSAVPQEPAKDPSVWPSLITSTGTVLAAAAWPIGIVVTAVIFRKQISALIGRLKSVKGPGGFELTTEELIDALPPQDTQENAAQEEIIEETTRLSPIDAIVTAWVSVERAISSLHDRVDLITMSGIGAKSRPSVRPTLDFLVRAGIVQPSLASEVKLLNQVRNRAVHFPDEEISQEAVRTYVSNAASVVAIINAIPGDLELS